MLKFRCKKCDQKIGVPEEWAGRGVRCPRCRHAVPVPKLVDAIVQTVTATSKPHTASHPATPKPPLMPMPPLKGKTIAVPHPAVKPKTAAKAPVAKPIQPKAKPVDPPARPDRQKAPPAPEPHPEVPDPVVVTARRKAADSIVTEVRSEKDFSSLFADTGAKGVGPSDLQSAAPPAHESHSGPPLSEMMDAFGGSEDAGVTSSTTVSDIVRGLTRLPADQFSAEPISAPRQHAPALRRMTPSTNRDNNTAARALGVAAMLVGIMALSLCIMPRLTRFALPVGALGLLVAIIGALVPARRRGTEIALAIGSSAISMSGVALALLVATGIVPSAATAHAGPSRSHLPSARLGDVEVRVASAAIVRPVFYEDGKKSPTVDEKPFLCVNLEVRNLAKSGAVPYKTWGAARADVEPVILLDNDGNQLKLFDPPHKTPPGRPRQFPTNIEVKSNGVCDVLVFEAPPAAVRELYLQLPGSNLQLSGGFNLQIPVSMLRRS